MRQAMKCSVPREWLELKVQEKLGTKSPVLFLLLLLHMWNKYLSKVGLGRKKH